MSWALTELAIPVLLSLLSIWIRGDLSLSGMSTRKERRHIDSNPKHYKIEDGADIADTDSANYGLSKGLNADLPAYLNNSHTYLDVRHPADNAIRRKMVKKWKNAKNVLNGGRYADIVKRLERP